MELMFWSLVTVFATYRMTLMVTSEEGPFRLAEIFRNLFVNEDWIGRGIRCFWCVSFWVAFVGAIIPALKFDLNWAEYGLSAIAVSGLAIFIHEQRWKR